MSFFNMILGGFFVVFFVCSRRLMGLESRSGIINSHIGKSI